MAVSHEGLLRLLAVVEAGSFAAAARASGVSRQAMHRSVETLERQCGAPLLDRGAHGLRLTDLGRRLLPHAQALRRAGRDAEALIAAATQLPSGTVRLTAPALFAEAVLAKVLPRFLLAWPHVRIEARFDTGRSDLHRDDYDLMIRIGAAPSGDTYAVLLGRAGLCLCAAPSYVERRGLPLHPSDLVGHDLLAYGDRPPTSWLFEHEPESVSVDVEPRLSGNDAAVLIAACIAGVGLLRVPAMAVGNELRRGRLVAVLDGWTAPAADVWAVYGHRTHADPTLAALLDALRRARSYGFVSTGPYTSSASETDLKSSAT